jgi:hypothetical protein
MLVVIVAVLASLVHASAQAIPPRPQPIPAGAVAALPAVSRAPASAFVLEVLPPTHAFWDRENLLLFAGVGVMRTLDYTSTHNMLRRGREELLIPDDVVKNDAGFAALEAAASVTSIGISYIFHHYRHHTMERWVSIVHVGVTGFGAAHNYALKTKR